MSGPVATEDAAPRGGALPPAEGPVVELRPGRVTSVGSLPVRRVLPQHPRRTVGPWCFADHVGPVPAREAGELGIGPHPHMGLQTVTWLVQGELLHLDSLGSEQPIRPGQLNLMTAGHGVAHAEEDSRRAPTLHAVQLWVAQPEETRHGAAAFEHHAVLPQAEFEGGTATVLVGELGGEASPARRDTDHMGAELVVQAPGALVPLRKEHEYALVVLEGRVIVRIPGHAAPVLRSARSELEVTAEPGNLAYLGSGRDELALETNEPARVLLLGGVPFPEPVLMWWNFVARTRDEVSEARRQWTARDARFGRVRSRLGRIEVGPPPWESPATTPPSRAG
jgi:quercetin 2,3-dioxygenase